MFGCWNNTKKDDPSEAEILLDEIIDILFPPLETRVTADGLHKYQVDYSVDSNLDAALIDLEEGHNDEVTQNTIRKASDKLFKVRQMLDIQTDLDPQANFLVVDNDAMDDISTTINAKEGP